MQYYVNFEKSDGEAHLLNLDDLHILLKRDRKIDIPVILLLGCDSELIEKMFLTAKNHVVSTREQILDEACIYFLQHFLDYKFHDR